MRRGQAVLRALLWVARQPFLGPGAVLLYHRVTELSSDPWGLAVPPATFDAHLALLAERATCLKLPELVERSAAGSLPDNALALTFDDGYADNLEQALPLLERHGLPATFFILTGFIDSDEEAWWDRLEQAAFATEDLPERIVLRATGRELAWTRPEGTLTPAARDALHATLYAACAALDSDARERLLAELWRALGAAPRLRSSHRPLTLAELRRLAAHPLVTIGAHTRSHPHLARIPKARQREELAAAKATLETWLERRIDLVAYPHGSCDATTTALAAELGYRAGFTTRAQRLPRRLGPHRVPRINVEPQDSGQLARLLARHGIIR